MGRSHGEELEEDDPDLAFAVAVSMEEYRVQLHVPRVATRRSSEEDLQEALKRSRLETGSAQEQKGWGEGKDRVPSPSGVVFQTSTHAVDKPTEIVKSPTSSRTTIEDPVMPQEEGINHAISIRRSKPQRPRGAKEGKPHRRSGQEVTREASLGRQRSASHTRDGVTKIQKNQEPSRHRIVQKWETAGQTRRPGIP